MSAESGRSTIKVKKKWGKIYEKTIITRDIVLTEEKADEITKELKSVSSITPQALANKHNIRVSIARKILQNYVDAGKLHLHFKNGKHEVYKS